MILKTIILLFLLTPPYSQVGADSNSSVESHGEKEEAERNIILHDVVGEPTEVNLSPEDARTEDADDKKNFNADDTLWSRNFNSSDYEEPKVIDEDTVESDPENNLDQESGESVNRFLLDNSNGDDFPNRKTEETTNGTVDEPTVVRASSVVSSSASCKFGERCKSSTSSFNIGSLMSKVKALFSPTPASTFTVPSNTFLNGFDSPANETSASFNVSLARRIPTSLNPESATGATSENVIQVDATEPKKDESANQTELIKNEKGKFAKHGTTQESPSSKPAFTRPSTTLPTTSPHDGRVSPSLDSRKFHSVISTETDFITISTPLETEKLSKLTSLEGVEEIDKHVIEGSNHEDNSKRLESLPGDILKEEEKIRFNNNKLDYDVPGTQASTSGLEISVHLQTVSPHRTERTETLKPSFIEANNYTRVNDIEAKPGFHTPALPAQPTTNVVKVTTTPPPPTTGTRADPPPRLTNPSCSSLPACVQITLLETTWEEFCSQRGQFREFLSKYVSHYTRTIHPHHIVLDAGECDGTTPGDRPRAVGDEVRAAFYVTDDFGEYEERLTEVCGMILRKWAPTAFRNAVIEFRLFSNELQATPPPPVVIPELSSGFVAAISISAVAGVALCLLCILLVVMKQKMVRGSETTTASRVDAYSLDSLSISASFRRRRSRRSARSYLNHAFNDQEIPSRPLNEKALINCLKNKDIIDEEFRKIPMNMPKLDSIPEGAHVKNRYSNILPRPETRVILYEAAEDTLKSYINANFVKGHSGKPTFYVACQAPLPEGVEDFWRMVWEQQCKVIVMLTKFEENGTSRCAVYFPQSTLISDPPFGDFQITLLKKDVYEFYTVSTMRVLDLDKNAIRDVVHLWFTAWPDVGVPKDTSQLVTFVQHCRPYMNSNPGPTVVHCSTGTGRTGVFLALDMCMREYDESRSMDILQCICRMRKERGGAVQNKDQYILIHEALLEYATRIANQSHRPSVCSRN